MRGRDGEGEKEGSKSTLQRDLLESLLEDRRSGLHLLLRDDESGDESNDLNATNGAEKKESAGSQTTRRNVDGIAKKKLTG